MERTSQSVYKKLVLSLKFAVFFALYSVFAAVAHGQTLISISNAPPTVTTGVAGTSQFWPNAGSVNGTPISLRATLTSISAGDTVSFFTSGDNPVVRANTGTLDSSVLWEVFNAATGAPILADPNFLITDIDGSNGSPIESVSAACAGLTSYTINGDFGLPNGGVCNANTNTQCQTNIRVSESGGNILGEGTQNQNGNQQEGYLQYSWNGISSWVVNYFATTGGRWFVHDADGDVPFDGTRVAINLVEMATIKQLAPGSLASPEPGEFITFEIIMSNAGPENATGGNLIDTLPPGLNLVSASADNGIVTTSAGPPETISWTDVNVPVGVDRTLTVVAQVDASVAPGAILTNETSTALANESVCSSRDQLTFTFTVSEPPVPELTIQKSISPDTSFDAAGDTITYSYLISNVGNVDIENVMPTDSGPTFNGFPGVNALVGFSPPSVTITPGNSQVFTATYLLNQVDVDLMAAAGDPLTAIDNTASAVGDPVDGVLAPVIDSTVETGFAPMPSLTVVKGVSAATSFSAAGDTITYEYTVTNTGNITVDSVVPTDAGPTFNGIAAAGTLSGFTPPAASIAPQENLVFTATYQLQQDDVDNMAAAADPLTAIDNTASASGDPVGAAPLPTVPDSTVETGFLPDPSMTVAKSVAAAPVFSQAGDTITYEYELVNTGNVTINNAVPTDSGPTFNGVVGTNSLSGFSPATVTLLPAVPPAAPVPVTVTASYVLSQQDIDNMFAAADTTTAIENIASATGEPTGGTLPTVPDSTAVTGFTLDATLEVAKSAGVPTVGLGLNTAATDADDTIAYSFEVTNSGDVTIDMLSIDDSGPTFNSAAGSGSLSAINCPLTALDPGQMTTCTATYTLSQADVDNAIIGGANAVENTATATGQDPADNPVNSPDATANATIANDASIEIAKSASAPTTTNGADATLVDPGDSIAYQLAVDNTGNTTLSNVLVTDSIAAVTCPATTNLGNPFINDGSAELLVGDGVVCTAEYVLEQTDLDAGGVQNTATVASTDPTGVGVGDTSVVDSGFTQKTSVALTKSATPLPDPANDGDPITYTFMLTNTGNVTLTSPQITDPICEVPAGPLTFTNGYQRGDGGAVGEMEAGETWEFECVYTIDQDDVDDGEVANTATGTGTPPPSSGLPDPSNTASNLAKAQQNAAIALDKSSSLPTVSAGNLTTATDVGDTIAYSFLVENTGNVTLTNVMVTDPLITAAPNSGNIDCPAGISLMVPGDTVTCTATYSVTQPDIDAGMIANTADVIGTPPPSVPQADSPQASSSNMVTIAPMPDLEVEKSVGTLTAPLAQGNLITYTVVVENTGNVTIDGVTPVDSGPTFNGAPGTNNLSAFVPTPVSLQPNTSQSFMATYELSQTDIDNIAAAVDPLTAIDNSASATGVPENGSLPTIEPSVTETGAAPNPLVELAKNSTAPVPVIAGADINYTFTLSNTGNVTLENPVINDARCVVPGAVLTFTSGFDSGDTGATPGALDVGEVWSFSCTYPISQADINAGTVANMATGGGQDPSGATIEDDASVDTPLDQVSDWNITKGTNSTPSVAGDTLIYQFMLENLGNVDISSVSVVDAKCAVAPVLISGDIGSDLILSPPETWTYECTSIAVTQTEVDDGMVDNTVDVTGSAPPSAPPLAPDQATESTTILPMAELSIEKTAAAPTTGLGGISSATDAGDTISYSFVVTNEGNVSISALTVVDPGPTFAGNAGTAANWTGVSCPVTTLLPMQSTTCSATYTLTQTDVNNAVAAGLNSVENSAEAQGQDPDTGAVTSPPSVAMTSITSDPMVQILKTAGAPTTVLGLDPVLTDPGDTVDYEITVENTGNTALDNVLVADSLTTVNCPAVASPSGDAFTNLGDASSVLAVGDSVVCLATYTIEQTDINNGNVVNTATVTSSDPAGTPVNGVVEETTSFTQKTSIALEKSALPLPTVPAPVANDLITYTFVLENTGNVSLTGAQVDDGQCQIPAGPLTATNGLDLLTDDNSDGILDAGESWTFECQYALTSDDLDAGGEITNTATGSGTPPVDSGLDVPSSTSSAVVRAQLFSAITLDKVAGIPSDADGTLLTATDVGDSVTFTFNIVNESNVTFETVSLLDPLITASPNNGSFNCVLSGTATAFVLDTDPLPAGDGVTCTADYELTQIDIDAGSISNTATAAGDPPGDVPPPPEASSGSMVPITPEPSLSIDKSVLTIPANVTAGTIITYNYTVENTGNVSISNVAPIDLGPTFNGVTGTNALSGYSPTVAQLAPGTSQLFTATYEISQQDLDNMAAAADPTTAIANTATADGEPANGTIPPVPPSTVETGVAPDPMLELIKTSSIVAPVAAGSVVTYTFSLRNSGNVTISNPIITDAQCQTPASPLSFSSGYVSGDTGVIAQSLDVGETWVFSCGYAITQTDLDAGTVQNTANGSGQDPAGNPVDDDSDTANSGDGGTGDDDPTNTLLPRTPAWEIDKSTLSVPTAANQTLDYTFVLTNTGNTSINTIIVEDAKCVGGVATLDTSTDVGSDNVLSPAGAGGVPAAEQWAYSCTSIPVTQDEMNAGVVINEVAAMGTAPGGGLENATDREETDVVQTPSMSLVKSAGTATLNSDGSFDQSFDFELKNLGNISLNNVTISDDIPAQFGACYVGVAQAGIVSVNDVAPLADSVNAVSGAAPIIAMADSIGVGDSLIVSGFSVQFDPNAAGCVFPDPAQNSASGGSNEANDVSDNGIDPDTAGPDDAGVPTPFTPPTPNPELGLAKSATLLAFNDDFSFDVEYTILIQNTGDVDLTNLELFDDLVTQFGAAYVPSAATDTSGGVLTAPVVSVVSDAGDLDLQLPNVDATFDGGAGNIFDGSSGTLGVGDVIQVVFSVRANPALLPVLPADFRNVADGAATAPDGSTVSDQSNSGNDPTDGSGGGVAPTIVTLEDIADLPIVLGKFTSQLVGQTLLIEWQTQTEVGNLGFNLYGKVGEDDWQRLNPDVIPGQGDSVEVVSYSFSASALGVTALAISDVNARGEEELHGPFLIGKAYGAEQQRKTTDWSDSIKRSQTKQQTRDAKRREKMLERSRERQQRMLKSGS